MASTTKGRGKRKSKRPFAVVKATDRIQFPERPDLSKPSYFFECLDYAAADKSTQAYLAEFPRRNPGEEREHFHEGSEFIFVLDGVLTVLHSQVREARSHLRTRLYALRLADDDAFRADVDQLAEEIDAGRPPATFSLGDVLESQGLT